MPRSAANFLAAGLANGRSPETGFDAGGGGAAATGGGAGALGAGGAADFGASDPSSTKSANFATSSAFSTIIHKSLPTGISFDPAGSRTLARYPSSGVSNPIVALSVSISHNKSP